MFLGIALFEVVYLEVYALTPERRPDRNFRFQNLPLTFLIFISLSAFLAYSFILCLREFLRTRL